VELDKRMGTLNFSQVEVRERISFLEYVMGGCEISVHVAIDFTLSNGDPK
jgi:hypothetical protein